MVPHRIGNFYDDRGIQLYRFWLLSNTRIVSKPSIIPVVIRDFNSYCSSGCGPVWVFDVHRDVERGRGNDDAQETAQTVLGRHLRAHETPASSWRIRYVVHIGFTGTFTLLNVIYHCCLLTDLVLLLHRRRERFDFTVRPSLRRLPPTCRVVSSSPATLESAQTGWKAYYSKEDE